MPDSVVHAVEEVQEHGSHVAGGGPVRRGEGFGTDTLASVLLLPREAATPDGHRQNEKNTQGNSSAEATADTLDIQQRADEGSGDDLSEPVEEAVQGLGAGVKVGSVDAVLLVGVEPVGGKEHGEEEDDIGLRDDGVPQADDFGLPARVLHQDNLGAIRTNDLVGIANEEGQAGADEHENDERDVGAITDVAVGLDVDVLSERDLCSLFSCG